MVEVEIEHVVQRVALPEAGAEAGGDQPPAPRVVVLKEKTGQRRLPIWIGQYEADMLALQLAGRSAPRPLTYDLFGRLLELTQARLERVVIGRLSGQVFHAALHLRLGDQAHEVDGRPSDALNLALRAGAPVLVDPQIMQAEALLPEALEQKLGGGPWTWVPVPPPEINPPPRA